MGPESAVQQAGDALRLRKEGEAGEGGKPVGQLWALPAVPEAR